jgi:hypothetical protein
LRIVAKARGFTSPTSELKARVVDQKNERWSANADLVNEAAQIGRIDQARQHAVGLRRRQQEVSWRTKRECTEALPVLGRQTVHVAMSQVRPEAALRIDRLIDLGTDGLYSTSSTLLTVMA